MAEKKVRALDGSDVGKEITYEEKTSTLVKVVHETNRSEITLGGTTFPITFPAKFSGEIAIASEQFDTASVEIAEP